MSSYGDENSGGSRSRARMGMQLPTLEQLKTARTINHWVVPIVCTAVAVILLLTLVSSAPADKTWLAVALIGIGLVSVWLWTVHTQRDRARKALEPVVELTRGIQRGVRRFRRQD